VITRNKKIFFTGEFRGSSPPERVQLGYLFRLRRKRPLSGLELLAIAWR